MNLLVIPISDSSQLNCDGTKCFNEEQLSQNSFDISIFLVITWIIAVLGLFFTRPAGFFSTQDENRKNDGQLETPQPPEMS